MAKKKLNVIGLVFACLVLVGLVLTIVGMCTGILSTTVLGETKSVTLFDEIWEQLAKTSEGANKLNVDVTIPSRTFTLVAFIVTLVGAVVLLANAVLKLLGKDVKFLGLIGGAVAVVGAILILVAGLVLAGQYNDYLGVEVWSAGVGIWLGFIGGLVAGAAGILSSLKMFNK